MPFWKSAPAPPPVDTAVVPVEEVPAAYVEAASILPSPPMVHDGKLHRRLRRTWRQDQWGCTRLGCGKLCAVGCCIFWLLLGAFLVAFFLWARMPAFTFNGVQNIAFSQAGNGFLINFDLVLIIDNPNFIGVNVQTIDALAYEPVMPDVRFANGSLNGLSIASRAPTTIQFPMTLNYSQAADPQSVILSDLATRCGIEGNPKTQIQVNVVVDATFKVVASSLILPQIRLPIYLDCPVEFNSSLPLLAGF